MLNRINELLKEKGMTMEQLSEQSGISKEQIQNWNNALPSMESLEKVSDVLGKSCHYLMYGTEMKDCTVDYKGQKVKIIMEDKECCGKKDCSCECHTQS